ncbi:hypothetical protein PMG11_02579 [Penicillium brasilianum]|uniref:Uncharacterized protein n=1 Tax=Penicillium brasilianum TaxID=104259 RepID=A0A0F7TKC7_PENBI|nr:hypothetical protein PMG11_02579 [Penicillium brasilianum]
MKSFFGIAAIAAGTQALVTRGGSCCFHLTASGGSSGSVGQLSDGQNRIGDNSLSPAEFCIDSGSITDGSGRGCILTPPTTQFQCDVGATPTAGFSINSMGLLEFDGSTNFVACETGQNGGLNIYTTESSALSNCKTIQLTADSCATPPQTTTTQSSAATTSAANTGCGTTLTSNNFEFPHLIIPIDSSSPNTAAGTKFNGKVTSSVSSIFNFDIPKSDSGKTCSLVFLFPRQSDLQTSSFTFSGDGKVDFAELSSAATTSTTFNNAPSVSEDLGTITVSPGNSFVVSTFSCPAGKTVAFEMKNAGSTNFEFFQDFNPSPIGLFITVC